MLVIDKKKTTDNQNITAFHELLSWDRTVIDAVYYLNCDLNNYFQSANTSVTPQLESNCSLEVMDDLTWHHINKKTKKKLFFFSSRVFWVKDSLFVFFCVCHTLDACTVFFRIWGESRKSATNLYGVSQVSITSNKCSIFSAAHNTRIFSVHPFWPRRPAFHLDCPADRLLRYYFFFFRVE